MKTVYRYIPREILATPTPAGQGNHIIDWEVKEIAEQESEKFKRWIKESIQIRANKILTTNIKKN